MGAKGILLLLLLVPLAAGKPLEVSDPVQVSALAVAQMADGTLRGVTAEVEASAIRDGSGRVFVETKPLAQTDMQGSARQAARVAASLLGLDWRSYDFLVVFRSESPVIGGPSAGAVMTVALTTALWNLEHPSDPWRLDAGVAATGTINPDGTIGPVGGVPAKAEGAATAGIHTFFFPAGLEHPVVQTESGPAQVDMKRHCATLRIICRPAATVVDVLEAAADVRLDQPAVPTPTTSDYGTVLEPRVTPDVSRLAGRIARAQTALDSTDLTAARRNAVQEDLNTAAGLLAKARTALDTQRYYTAATMAFQGNIHVGTAENRTAYYVSNLEPTFVRASIDACAAAAAAATAHVENLTAATLNRLYTVGAAQIRAVDAHDLHAEAEGIYRGTLDREVWVQALFTASFCTERARTATWWAQLGQVFGEGPVVANMDGLLRDTMDRAREAVVYADAVLGGGVEQAEMFYAQAQQHAQDGQPAAAILSALQAQTEASVVMQVQTGGTPDAVLAAAKKAASRAIAQARAAGAEPILAVSQLELAGDTEDADQALGNAWYARSVALLGEQTPPAPAIREGPRTDDPAAVGLVLGALLGASLIGVVISLVALRGLRND